MGRKYSREDIVKNIEISFASEACPPQNEMFHEKYRDASLYSCGEFHEMAVRLTESSEREKLDEVALDFLLSYLSLDALRFFLPKILRSLLRGDLEIDSNLAGTFFDFTNENLRFGRTHTAAMFNSYLDNLDSEKKSTFLEGIEELL